MSPQKVEKLVTKMEQKKEKDFMVPLLHQPPGAIIFLLGDQNL